MSISYHNRALVIRVTTRVKRQQESCKYHTSVSSWASTLCYSVNCEVASGTSYFGENSSSIRGDVYVKILVLEGKYSLILALPLLEVTVLITIIKAHSTAHCLPLCSQTLIVVRDKEAVVWCPAHGKAVIIFRHHQTPKKASTGKYKFWICGERVVQGFSREIFRPYLKHLELVKGWKLSQ